MIFPAPKFKPHYTESLSSVSFYRLIFLAIIVRLLLMPFFAHHDLLSEAKRVYLWDQSGISIGQFGRDATLLFELLFYKLFSAFFSDEHMLFSISGSQSLTASAADYFEFVSHDSIFRTLFILKIPYLVADLITAWAIYLFCQRSIGGGRNAVIFWLFNPITLFAFYVFGRFESIPIMFCILSLLAVQRHKLILAALLISLSINAREVFIFLGPLFIAVIWSASSERYSLIVRSAATTIIAVALLLALQVFSSTNLPVDVAPTLLADSRVNQLFRFSIGMYSLFPLVYFLILLYAWCSKTNFEVKTVLLVSSILFAFFLFSLHAPHYTAWLILFPCLYLSVDQRLLKPMLLFCAAWFAYNLTLNDLGYFTFWLASPLSLEFSGLPSFAAWYEAQSFNALLSIDKLRRLTSALYAACLLFMWVQIVQIYRVQIKQDD